MSARSDPLVLNVVVHVLSGMSGDETTQFAFTCSPREYDFLRWLSERLKDTNVYGPRFTVAERKHGQAS